MITKTQRRLYLNFILRTSGESPMPVWSFTTQIAKPIVRRSSAMVLLTPTPEFWGHPKGRTGTNHPHAIIYLGMRVEQFKEAFRDYGIPVQLM